jgi:hypothetical protein
MESSGCGRSHPKGLSDEYRPKIVNGAFTNAALASRRKHACIAVARPLIQKRSPPQNESFIRIDRRSGFTGVIVLVTHAACELE